MSKAQITFAVIISGLILASLPPLVMAYRRDKACRYFAIAHIFLFLGVILSTWLPLITLSTSWETAIYILEFCSLTAYIALALWFLVRSHRIYKSTGKWPNIWALEDTSK